MKNSKKNGGSTTKAESVRTGERVEIVQGKDRSRMRWHPLQSAPGFDKRDERRSRGIHGKV